MYERTPQNTPCQWCGLYHGTLCPSVKSLEYHPDGVSLKRVVFRDLQPIANGGGFVGRERFWESESTSQQVTYTNGTWPPVSPTTYLPPINMAAGRLEEDARE